MRLCGSLKSAQGAPAGMQGLRGAVGTLLLWTPLVIFVLFGLSGVLLGSMGMDVRWTSKEAPYIAATCVVLLVCACVAAGSQIAKRDKDLKQVNRNQTSQAAVLANTAFVLSASHGSDLFSLRSPQRPLA